MSSARRLLLSLLAVALLIAIASWAVLGGGRTNESQRPGPAQATESASTSAALDPAESRAPREAQTGRAAQGSPSTPPGANDGLWLCLCDSNGAALGGISLEVSLELWRTLGEEHDEKYQTVSVTTDARGRARIAARYPEEIEAVRIPWPGGEPLQVDPDFEAWPGAPDEVHLVAPTAAVVRGRVVDLAGQPVRGARIELVPRATAPRTLGLHEFRALGGETTSDAQGRFALDTSCGWFVLSAAAPGEAAAEELTFVLDPGQAEIETVLCLPKAERHVLVRLNSPQAFDPSDVWVGAHGTIAWPARADAGGRIVSRAHSELRAHGVARAGPVWELELPRGGEWKVSAGGAAFESSSLALPDDATELTLQLVPTRPVEPLRLSGHVRDAAGRPLLAALTLLRAGDLGRFDQASTNLAGEFVFLRTARSQEEDLAYVFARCPGYGAAGLGPLSIARARKGLEIVLGAGRSIAGRIEGLPPGTAAKLTLRSRTERFTGAEVERPGQWLTRVLDGEGFSISEPSFVISDLPEGEYELWIAPEDPTLPPARARVHAGQEDLVLRLGTGLEEQLALDCRVLDALTGQPVAGAVVELRGESSDNPPSGSSGRTNAEGRCALLGHAPGRWCVVVSAAGYALLPDRFTDFTLGTHALELRLAPACTLELELVAPDGTPRPALELCATTLDGALLNLQERHGQWIGSYTHSDSAGRARLRGLPAGRVRVVVGWKDGQPHEIYDDGKCSGLENPERLFVFEHEIAVGQHAIVRQLVP